MILALGALLASACLADVLARELPSLARRPAADAERLAGRALLPSTAQPDAQRAALVRSTAPAIARLKSPQGSTDGARGTGMVAAPANQFALVALRSAGEAVEARSYGVRSPGQPASTSRAPPIA